jgi:Fe-S-cluster containining protein
MDTSTESVAQHDQAVRERWQKIGEGGRVKRIVNAINERAQPVKRRHSQEFNRMMNDPAITVDALIIRLWKMVDEIGALAKPHAACRRGCSHCCHIPVLIPEQEANLIGRFIHVKPEKVEGITQAREIRTGYDNPCPFLKDDQCSIYAHRPLACRQQFNMDRDALLCELVGDKASTVPYLNLRDYTNALVTITIHREETIARNPATGHMVPCLKETAPNVGDIREFFPRGKA